MIVEGFEVLGDDYFIQDFSGSSIRVFDEIHRVMRDRGALCATILSSETARGKSVARVAFGLRGSKEGVPDIGVG